MTLKQIFKKPITQQYPEYKRPVYPRFRGRHRLWTARERAREVRRLLALRRRLPGRLHPRRRRREHRREPRLGRRALRAHLRDQPQPLHLLRLLRARLPVRRDHARQRVRDLGVQPRRPDLHEGHAARARRSSGCPSPTRRSTTRRSPTTRRTRSCMANVLVWVVWVVAAFACLGSGIAVVTVPQPVLLGARADREPRLARRALPAADGASSSPPRRCSSTRAR